MIQQANILDTPPDEIISIPLSANKIHVKQFYNKRIKKIIVPCKCKLTLICFDSFSFSSIESIAIPKSVKEIEQYAFSYCKNLKTVKFAEDNEYIKIGSYSFFESSIESLYFPSGIIDLDDDWSYGTSQLKQIFLPKSNNQLAYNDQILLLKAENIITFASRDIQNVVIPSFIKQICSSSFYSCNQIKFLDLSKNLELNSIGPHSFCNSSIEVIIIPENVKTIGKYSFSCCKKLNKVIFTENSKLTNIEKNAFAFTSIEFIVIPASVKIIEDNAFSSCKQLKIVEVMLNSQLQKIGKSCFYDCTKLKEIKIPQNSELEIIDEYAFYRSPLDYFYIPPKVSTIKPFTFEKCETIEISKNSDYIKIEKNAFSYVDKFLIMSKNVEFADDWAFEISYLNKVEFSKFNTKYKYLDNQYIVTKSDEKSDIYDVLLYARRGIILATIPSYIKIIASYAFSNCYRLRNLTFTKNSELTIIKDHAFEYTSIVCMTIPSNVKIIGDFAFRKCAYLENINFDDNSKLELIGKNSFDSTSIKSIKIPKSLKKIDQKAFWFCIKLEHFEIPKDSELEMIDIGAFEHTPIENSFH